MASFTSFKVNKKPWTAEEDENLLRLLDGKGASWKWSKISAKLSMNRTGKQCRERWKNHLSPQIKKGDWTSEEDNIIMEMKSQLGNQWTRISKYLPGRSDNAVKNRWHLIERSQSAVDDSSDNSTKRRRTTLKFGPQISDVSDIESVVDSSLEEIIYSHADHEHAFEDLSSPVSPTFPIIAYDYDRDHEVANGELSPQGPQIPIPTEPISSNDRVNIFNRSHSFFRDVLFDPRLNDCEEFGDNLLDLFSPFDEADISAASIDLLPASVSNASSLATSSASTSTSLSSPSFSPYPSLMQPRMETNIHGCPHCYYPPLIQVDSTMQMGSPINHFHANNLRGINPTSLQEYSFSSLPIPLPFYFQAI